MNNRLQAANLERLERQESFDLLGSQTVPSRGGLFVPCLPYRRFASLLKGFTKILLTSSTISVVYAGSTLEKVSSVYRLKGPLETPQSVRSEAVQRGAAACGAKPTADLILSFSSAQKAEEWINLEKFMGQGPCEIKAYPVAEGFELRLSYLSAGNTLQTLSYGTQTHWIVDHWLVPSSSAGKKKAPVAQTKKKTPINSLSLTPLANFSDQVLSIYQDQDSWNKILGDMGKAMSFESPELDRFRVAVSERDFSYEKLPRSRRRLAPPTLSLPMLDAQLEFAEEKFELLRFEEQDLLKSGDPRTKAALEGLNYLRKLFVDKEWLSARETMSVLEKGNVKDLVPSSSARWWALKGLIIKRLGAELKNQDMQREALDVWRDGLRKVAGRGAAEQAASDYMVLESLRELFENQQHYAAAAMLVWAQRFRWSPPTEERLAFLVAEAHYRLGLMDEAHQLFEKFVEARKDVPLSASFDRRLVPVAAFRLGDAKLRVNRYDEAVAQYSRAFAVIPTQQKISFEGTWFPSEIRQYPQVFFHRAEAQLRGGNVAAALSDLRAFVDFAADHPNLGLVLYRIGDLLELAGAPESKVQGAWRECIFRSGDRVGGKLCKARQSSASIDKNNRNLWPRLTAETEDVLQSKNISVFDPAFAVDLGVYVKLLLADAFLRAEDPFQSYQQTERSRGVEASEDLLAWNQEYRLSSLAGYLGTKVDSGRASEVMQILGRAKMVPGLNENRPELIWPLARAYSSLGLWQQAQLYIEQGIQANKTGRPADDRPYLPTEEQWKEQRSKVELSLLLAGNISADQVEKNLKELKNDAKNADVLRMWNRYYETVRKPLDEAKVLTKLKSISALSAEEWRRYFEVLAETKQEKILRAELETYVGPWMSSPSSSSPADAPSPQVFFMLFESRERLGDLAGAATVLSYLLSEKMEIGTLSREQLLFRQGQLRRKEGKVQEARQSFEDAKALAADSMWGRLSVSELQTL